MIITNLIVEKIEKDHPRYPADTPPHTQVFRCETTDAAGKQFEAAFFHSPALGDVTPEAIAKVLRMFARAVERMDEMSEAA
jgi:hypothetical protein